MPVREVDAVTVTLTPTELKTPMMDWLARDVHKELMIFKILPKLWLKPRVFQFTSITCSSCSY